MGYRLCKSTGVIHANGEGLKKVCKRSLAIRKGNYEDCRTKSEAEAAVRDLKKEPRYCKHCGFTDALQMEADK